MMRQERVIGTVVALLLLLVPFFHPLAEANAAGRRDAGFICSSFGSAEETAIPAQADDCPMGISCVGIAAAADQSDATAWNLIVFPAVLAVSTPRLSAARRDKFVLCYRPPGQGPPATS